MKLTVLFCAGLAVFGASADARPVSYPGGWTVMQRNTSNMSSLHVHYSPTFQDSIGLYSEQNWQQDHTFVGVQYNRLVKRWNAPNSQANLYVKAIAGVAESFHSSDQDISGSIGIAADWETRRWFTSWEGQYHDVAGEQYSHQAARLGVAPYIGDYGDLHTWLMIEVENSPEAEEKLTVTPLVRFFYDVQLLEIGYTPETERFMLNWIVRF